MFQKWKEKVIVNGIEKEIEIRKDGYWQRRCRIIQRAGLELTKEEDFSDLINKECIFCQPEKLAKFDFGMLENEVAFLFPNINPYAEYSSVCAFKKHFIKPNEFTALLIQKNLELCIEYIKKIEAEYISINWNYLMPAGASILHPHLQVVGSNYPTTYMEKIENIRFEEYVKKEIESERYVGRIGNIEIFTPFVPFGFNEIVGVAKGNIFKEYRSIAEALEKIIAFYASIGRNSFNISIYTNPLHFRCITRQNMVKYYRNDAMFFERLHNEIILEKKPEEVAREFKDFS